MNQDPILLKILKQATFTEKEAQTYLALLELGQGTVSDIAKIADLKRPIIYIILEGLIKRGYVSETPGRKINTYQATDPSLIATQLNSFAKNFLDMLPIMKTLSEKGKNKPKISYYDTMESIWNAYNEVNNYEKAFFITSLSKIENLFPGALKEWENSYQKKRNKLQSRNLIPNNNQDIEIVKRFMSITDSVKAKILPELKDCGVDLAIYGNKLSIASFAEKPFLVVITSEELIKTILPIFEIAWENGKMLTK